MTGSATEDLEQLPIVAVRRFGTPQRADRVFQPDERQPQDGIAAVITAGSTSFADAS